MNIVDFSSKTIQDINFREIIEKQIETCMSYSRYGRKCPSLPDIEFIMLGLSRMYKEYQSGRDFLQAEEEMNDNEVARSTFFDAFQSERRQNLIADVHRVYCDLLNKAVADRGTNYFSDFTELNDYEIYSADGHFIKHACHSEKSKKGTVYAPGSIYGLNMKTGMMVFLASVADGSRKSHEMPEFRRYLNESCPDKPRIWILDRAYVDGLFWYQQKKNNQYTISQLKENIKASMQKLGELEYDKQDPVNTGVTAYYLAGTGTSVEPWRIVEYTDPETLEEYTFYTTLDDKNIKPGMIAWLYSKRWDIEKVYDNFKNTMHVKKSWATGIEAQAIQACLTVMTYNLTRLITETLNAEGHKDEKVIKKHQKKLKNRESKAEGLDRKLNPFLWLENRMSRISQQFLRSLQSSFLQNLTFCLMKPRLIKQLRSYI